MAATKTKMPDFGGYATRNDLKCSDGRIIRANAFKHNAGVRVPLVWQHQKNAPENILGYAELEHRSDGVYAHAYFNDTASAATAKNLIKHGDITALSIYANNLVQQGQDVIHGQIREVSLVVAGANPGAYIDNVNILHSDGTSTTDVEEAVLYTGLTLEHAEEATEEVVEPEPAPEVQPEPTPEPAAEPAVETTLEHADDKVSTSEKTVEDVFNTLSEEQKTVVYYLIGAAMEDNDAEHSDDYSAYLQHEGYDMGNVFESNFAAPQGRQYLSHEDSEAIFDDALKLGSFKASILEHAQDYGIEDIDILFPDAKAVANSPELLARRMEWVTAVITGTKHTPFARIKTTVADITAEEARAKGYVKGTRKKEEIIKLLKRVTTPTTIYKKQKLDRDDLIDIRDFDVVAWLKAEMRLMLDEELARAILIGDGRDIDDEDKIDEDHIRPIASDDEMFAHKVTVPSNTTPKEMIAQILRSRTAYRGSGNPTLYTTDKILTDLLLIEDKVGRRLYETMESLAAALRVTKIVPVEAMEDSADVLAIVVNLVDYSVGADQGGQVAMFDDFDIDYNQQKYLIETRVSGALTKPKSALVLRREPGTLVTPQAPSWDGGTNTITIPTQAGVEYRINGSVKTGSQVIEEATDVEAFPTTGYSFPSNITTDWSFIPS